MSEQEKEKPKIIEKMKKPLPPPFRDILLETKKAPPPPFSATPQTVATQPAISEKVKKEEKK